MCTEQYIAQWPCVGGFQLRYGGGAPLHSRTTRLNPANSLVSGDLARLFATACNASDQTQTSQQPVSYTHLTLPTSDLV